MTPWTVARCSGNVQSYTILESDLGISDNIRNTSALCFGFLVQILAHTYESEWDKCENVYSHVTGSKEKQELS